MNSLLLIGSEGYIGHYIVQFFESIGWTVHSTGLSESKRANYFALDITNQEAVAHIINQLRPQVIIQAAGLSSLALCEQEPERARAVNVGGTKNIIDAVRSLGEACKLVFLSSDYVFDGESGNYDEESERRPKTEYGRNKLASEVAIQDSLQNYIILRMSNVYGHGGNFYNFVTSHLAAEQPVELFDDTHFTPVSIEYLARSLKGRSAFPATSSACGWPSSSTWMPGW
jgi:dTDP-4-dehydrorhamnose reductase